MADNIQSNDNILVDYDFQNVILVDPNKTVRIDGTVQERQIHHENLVMYANLEAKMLPRTKLAVGANLLDSVQTLPIASVNFLRPGGKTNLTNAYLDELTGLNSINGKGTNQPALNAFQQQNKTNEFFISQNTLNREDTGLLGIESIRIKNTRSMTPTVEMTLIDTQGRALFEKGENSEYASFFNLPYPTFYLTIKGYYGKAVRYQLILTNFSAAFEGNTGNYRISLKFYSYKYTVLAETQVGALFATPYMYQTDYRITSTTPQSAAVNAALSSNGNTTSLTNNVRTTKGYEKIKNVYKKYKANGLIPEDLPELTVPELRIRLFTLEQNLQKGFGEADFTPLSDVNSYYELLTKFRDDVVGVSDSWFSKNINADKPFILKKPDPSGETITTWIYKTNILSDTKNQLQSDAYNQLRKLVTGYRDTLNKNKTLGLNGTFTVEGVKYNSQISTLNSLLVVPGVQDVSIPDSFKRALEPKDIDWEATFQLRNKRIGTPIEIGELELKESQFFRPTYQKTENDVLLPTYNFVFDGSPNGIPSFNKIIDETYSNVSKQKEKLILALNAFLEKKIEGPNGLGFRPTMRNIMGMIFASVEAFYLMMDDTHRDAWNQRLNPIRKRAVFDGAKTSVTPDSKDVVQTTNANTLANIPVYPWPLYYVETNSPDGEQFELRYPGDPKEVSRTRGNDYTVWPEVQFVEEYMKGIVRSQSDANTVSSSGDNNEGKTINRISVNAVDFPMTNIPYSNYEVVKFIYEIYERVLLSVYYDRLTKPNSAQLSVYKTLSDLEVSNIRTSLTSTSPSLTKILKDVPFTADNILVFLRNFSNDGTGASWQQFIRGEYTSEYMRTITTQDYSILEFDTLTPTTPTTLKNVDSLSAITQYVKSSLSTETDFTDLYPFTSDSWSLKNMAGITLNLDRYSTTKSLAVNTDKKFISNYFPNNDRENVPYTYGGFLAAIQPTPGIDLDAFYTSRNTTQNYLVTEGPVSYQAKTGNLTPNQSTSFLNTPIFVNSLMESIRLSKNNGVLYPYVQAAYVFLNSLPLGTLRERYKNISSPTDITLDKDLDYIFATLTKFGGVHRLPYAWILKYGSIWHRYKKYVEENVDILTDVWTNVDTAKLYDPTGSDLTKEYNFTNQQNQKYQVVAQKTITSVTPTNATYNTLNMNVGFYPKVINDLYYMATGVDLFTGYTDQQIDNAVTNNGLNLSTIQQSQIKLPVGFDNNNPTRLLNFNTWYVTIDFGVASPEMKRRFQNNTTMVVPSFGSLTNQVLGECFKNTATGVTLTQEVSNNKAVQDGSIRTFWNAPNYGYFELPSIKKPKYNEYVKLVYNSKSQQNAFKLSQQYSSIEDVFGTFKKEILDSFETEFLNFSKSYFTLSQDDIGKTTESNKNFQALMTNMLFIPYVDSQINSNDYVNKCSNAQMNNVTNVLNSFLSYNKTFRYGNPSNFDRKLFGTFTSLSLPPSNVANKYTYNAYVQNTLPTQGGTITYQQSYNLYTPAWKAMYSYVGFGTQSGMTYSDNGSYYTDFFPTMNVEFTEGNVKTFAPLIKIFGTQKLKVIEANPNDTYTKNNFVDGLNTYYDQKNVSINQVLTQLISSIQKDLPNVTETVEKPITSAIDGTQPKLEFYEAFKSFNDKWIAGTEYSDKTMFSDVLFLDRANRDIGDKILVDVFKLISFFSGTTSMDTRVIDFVSRIIADNQFQMMPLPAYINFWGVGEVKQGVAPNAEPSQQLANSLFGTFLDVDYRNSEPKFVCYYAGKPSEHLDMRDNPDYRWRTDAFDLRRSSDNPLMSKLQDKKDWALSNKVVAFNVDFGTRNQGIFYSIQLDQNPAAATTEGNKVITDMALGAGGRKTNTQNVSLYNLYKNRSYECRVEALGNAMIQPTMYFNLQHVPMFRGPYMVQSVEHVIDSGNFKTFFTGVRMPVYSLPLITKQIVSINQNLLSELTQAIFRLKETATTNAQPNVNIITIGNSVQPNGKFTSQPPIICYKDIEENPTYKNYTGIETVQTKISFSDFATKLKNLVPNDVTRLMTFYTAYLNGHDDKTLYSYNNDLGGSPLGGGAFPQISYAGRSQFLTPQYACKSNQNGLTQPYAVFSDFDNSIKFISNYYYNSQKPTSSLIYLDGKKWVKQTKDDIVANMISTWIKWWPTQRYKSKEEELKWAQANVDSFADLKKSAEEVLHQCKVYKLFNV